MKALRNVIHAGILSVWVALGVLFTARLLMSGDPFIPSLATAGSYWLWLGAFGAATTGLITVFEGPLATVAVHGGLVLVLSMLPRVFPVSLLRLGMDLLTQR